MIHTVTIERQDLDRKGPASRTMVKHVVEMTGDFRGNPFQETFGTNLLYSLNAGVSRAAKDGDITVVTVDYGNLPRTTQHLLWQVVNERVMVSLRQHAEHLEQWEKVRIKHDSDYKHFRVSAQLKGLV